MKKNDLHNHLVSAIFITFISMGFGSNTFCQQYIAWQQSIGTIYSDEAIKLFNDDGGNLVIIGNEVHEDFTGHLRDYILISKIDKDGHQLWKTYHDIAFETFSLPFDFYFGRHFYTEVNGEKFISLVIYIGGRKLLYKIADDTGEFNTFSEISSNTYAVDRNGVEVFANTLCSSAVSCYGPDSLIVQKVNPIPIIGTDPVEWTFELRQNIRTAPIQGHYDFNNQDITTDTAGNVYLLTQIERWDFQFCVDCGDVFIDAYSEIFKFDTSGQLVKHLKLKTAKAVVSNMKFVSNRDGQLLVKIDDINAAGTAIITSLYFLGDDLTINQQFGMDRQYNIVTVDEASNIFTCTNVFDVNDPNIKGLSDVLVSKFNSTGVQLWKSYFGGTNFDYPKGLVLTNDGGIAFFANTQSTDFDIAENHGEQDMWLVKLAENSTAVQKLDPSLYHLYPNPAKDNIYISGYSKDVDVILFDLKGRIVLHQHLDHPDQPVPVKDLPSGDYLIKVTENDRSVWLPVIKS